MNKSKASRAGSDLARRRAKRMTKEERRESARKAANARWEAVRERQKQIADEEQERRLQERRDAEQD